MSEWREVKLKDADCKFLSGYAFKSKDYSNKGIPLIKIGNIQNHKVGIDLNGTFINAALVTDKLSKYLLCNNDVLIAMTGQGSVGRVGKLNLPLNEKALLNQRVGKFTTTNTELNLNYLYYVLSSPAYQDFLFNAGSGSGQPNLSPELILETEIAIPPLPEQQAIAEVLSSLDDKIDLLHRNNKTLEEMADLLFNENYITDTRKAPLKLKEIVETSGGYNHDLSELSEDGDILLSMGSITKKYGLNLDRCRHIKKPNADSKILAVTGDIIISTRDITQDADLLGSPVIISKRIKKRIIVGSNLYKLEIIDQGIETIWLYFLLRSKSYREYVKEVASGTSILMLKKEDLLNFEFHPPVSNGTKLTSALTHLCNKIEANNEQIQMLNQTRNTLLPKLMSGQVRVKN
ncbi:MAG: restriction endonuclease subunit S [Flavobacteriales bacterium]